MRAARCASAARALGAGRRQPRAPMRQRLMRPGEPLEHCEVLAFAEPVAQPLGFLGPHAAEARPQRLDQLHLVAMIDDAPAQRMQIFGARQRPVGRNALARAAVADGELRRNRGEVERIERPLLDRRRRLIEPGEDGVAQLRREHRALLAAAQRFDAAANGRGRALRQHHALVEKVVEGVERRLRRRAHGRASGHGRAPRCRQRSASAMNGASSRISARHSFMARRKSCTASWLERSGSSDRGARLGQDMGRDGAHRRSDRRIGLQGRFVAHVRFYEACMTIR